MELKGYNFANYDNFSSAQQGDWEVFQQEIRFTSASDSPLQWITGLYYTLEESKQDTWVVTPFVPPTGGNSNSIILDGEYEAISGYFQLDYAINEAWSVTAGYRLTDDRLEATRYDKFNCISNAGVAIDVSTADRLDRDYREQHCTDISGSLATRNPKQELNEDAYKLGVNWFVNEGTMLYTSFSTGFKGGAFDNRALALGENPIGAEFLDALEIGFKSDISDSLQINGALFSYVWEDQQLFEVSPTQGPQQVNIPESELEGAELEIKWSPSNAFYTQIGLGYTSTEITDATGSQTAKNGNEITSAPDVTANALAVYTIPTANGEFNLQGAYRYVGEQWYFISNAPGSLRGSHDYLDARASYTFGDSLQYELALSGTNLTEEREYVRIGTGAIYPGDWRVGNQGFREWTLSFRVDL